MIEQGEPPKGSEGRSTTEGLSNGRRAREPLDRLLGLADSGRSTVPSRQNAPGTAPLAQVPEAIRKEIAKLTEELAAVRKELQRLQTADRVLSEMHTRCQELSEQFHEREVLNPLFYGLIWIADRSREQVQRIERTQESSAGNGDPRAKKALKYLLDARRADFIEVENVLGHFGVESFEHPGNSFDPASQKCINRVARHNGAAPGQIAARLLPGYTRNGKAIRREYVNVYVPELRPNANPGDHP